MSMILDNTTLDLSLDVCREMAGDVFATVSAQAPRTRQPNLQTRVETTRFGRLEVDPELVLTFPEGLIGFEQCKHYIVVRHEANSAFRWLQSLEEPHVAFPIVEPVEFCDDYAPTISDGDARFRELTAEAPTLLFTIVTVPKRSSHEMTANLLAPLVINGLTRRGKQVIVQDEGYTTRHKIMDELARRQERVKQAAAGGIAPNASTKVA